MEKLTLCRVCLNANVHHVIINTHLEIVYEKLTAMPTNDTRPLSVCYLCHAQLQSTKKLMLKCLTAETLFTEIMSQLADTEEKADDKATLIDRLRLGSALSVTPIVTLFSTYDDGDQDSDVDLKIKQEIINEQVDDDVENADDGSEAPITNQPELAAQIRASEVENCVKHMKYANTDSDIAMVEPSVSKLFNDKNITTSVTNKKMPVQYHPELLEASVSKLFNEKKITPSVNVNSKPDRQDNSDNIYHESIQSDITSITNQTLEQYQFETKLEKLNETQGSVLNKTIEIVANILCNRRLSNVKPLTDTSGCDGINMGDIPFTCNVCNKGFTTKPHLASHIRTHTGEKPFTCNVCNKSFARKDCLVRHTRGHTGEKPFTCNVCSKSLTTKTYLKRHILTHSDKPFTCNLCTKSYHTKQNLATHNRIHTGEKPFTCNVCSKSLTTKTYLKKHILTHSDKPFTCNLCTKSYHTKKKLATHNRIHTGDNPFTCSVCNKSLTTKSSLVCHIRSHTGEKPFTCNVCNKRCIGKQHLKSHICSPIPYL